MDVMMPVRLQLKERAGGRVGRNGVDVELVPVGRVQYFSRGAGANDGGAATSAQACADGPMRIYAQLE